MSHHDPRPLCMHALGFGATVFIHPRQGRVCICEHKVRQCCLSATLFVTRDAATGAADAKPNSRRRPASSYKVSAGRGRSQTIWLMQTTRCLASFGSLAAERKMKSASTSVPRSNDSRSLIKPRPFFNGLAFRPSSALLVAIGGDVLRNAARVMELTARVTCANSFIAKTTDSVYIARFDNAATLLKR